MPLKDPRKVFGQILLQIGQKNDRVLAVSCDSAKGAGMSAFIETFPDRYVECGIGEQNAIGVCAGLSAQGFIPVVAAITPFITMRCYEQIRDDIGYTKMNVKIVGSGGGLAYSTLGSTHEALEDVAIMRTIPHMIVLCPGDGYEVEQCLQEAVVTRGPVYIRMPRQAREEFAPLSKRNFVIGRGEVLAEGGDTAIIATGPSVGEAKKAAELLTGAGIHAAVVDCPTVEPLDVCLIKQLSGKYGTLFTVEEHSVVNGLGSAVADAVASQASACRVLKIAVPKGEKQVGPYDEVVDDYGLSGKKIATFIKSHINP